MILRRCVVLVPVTVQTLVVSTSNTPSVVVLCPVDSVTAPESLLIIPIWIGHHEAAQIGTAIEHIRFSRPMTHDLFLDALTNLDAIIDHIEIVKVEGSTFFAELIMKQYDREIRVDARPSDAIALAIRQKAPILMAEEVLNHASFTYNIKHTPTIKESEEELAAFRSFLTDLVPEDFKAL